MYPEERPVTMTDLYLTRRMRGDAAAIKLIVNAVVKTGNKVAAAETLGVSARTLHRLITEMNAHATIDAAMATAGKRQRTGRSRGPVSKPD